MRHIYCAYSNPVSSGSMDVDLTFIKNTFSDFFNQTYKEHINELSLQYPSKKSLSVDYGDIEKFDPDFADKLIKQPDVFIAAAEEALNEMNVALASGGRFSPHIRVFNLPTLDLIEHLTSKNINELVSFKGVITKRAEQMHRIKMAVYSCQLCDEKVKSIVGKNFTPPRKCPSCKKMALKQVDEECDFVDIQRAEIQELLEKVRGGAPAAKVELWFEDDLVNSVVPGENVEIVGVLRLRPPLKSRQKLDLVYSRFVEVLNVKSLKRDFEEIEINNDDIRRIKELATSSNIEQQIVKSIAPGIYGHAEVKHALALQLFGGTKGKSMKGMPIRDDIHLLLIGDPGIAKSRFLQSVNELAPKSIYVSGKTTSGAGLTVTAEKDELGEGGWTLKAGALVLASGGCAQVDEFDKINEEDRAAMHEAMETGTTSVAKAGIVAKFRTKTSILAAANPKFGRFDQTKNLAEQFDIPPTLLSRFDLIFPIVDVLDEEKDIKLASHILTAHMGEDPLHDSETILDRELLRKYIAYSRRNVKPKLSKDASEKIKEFYVDLRRKSKDSGSVAITPRYLEGLVRLAEANAKMRLNNGVEDRDAEVAIYLLNHVMKQVMTDKATGTFDVDTITTGKPKSVRDRLQKTDTVLEIIREHLKVRDSAAVEEIIREAAAYDIDEITTVRIIKELLRKGELYEKEHGHIKIVGE